MGNIINETETLKLVRPYHTWDTNYHIINKNSGVEMLVDINDIYSEEDLNGCDDLDGMLWEEFIQLDNLEELTYIIWKMFDYEGIEIEIGGFEEVYNNLI